MEFMKMHGAGNDFIIINNIEEQIPEKHFATLAKRLCQRRLAIGADGLILVEKAVGEADFRMVFYNSDGSRGEMCGNGARCIARYGFEKGLAGGLQRIETDAGDIYCERLSEDIYKVRLNDVTVMEEKGKITYVELGKPGISHAVLRVKGLKKISAEDLRQRAEEIRFSDSYPKGVNVNFYDFDGKDRIVGLTYEKGVEDFTLACGTGMGAVAAALSKKSLIKCNRITAKVPGGELEVVTEGEKLFLIGTATPVAEGQILLTQDLVVV